ncbi:hypothetical protein J8F10_03180 [Gemmata sp. G18]|uniref:Uncharacterized protein n=1 Tax=Gemmata palustris TaxID=2822762 RepID=A0ABS5BN54_9BACT|nr:hypothetical protein [Gemmata palustris]MBP3954298.1 hypothetical protein [Gemmata palustris]
MRHRLFAPLVVLLFAPHPARAAVVVIGNYTDAEIAFRIAEPNEKARAHKLPSNTVAPVYVTGPADITFTAKGRETKLRLDVYNAYLFLPDPVTTVRLEGLELPGPALERDARAEANPVPRDPPVKVPVTLLVDDADPRADKLWQAELRKRFDGAAGVIEKATSVRFMLAGFDTWKSDPGAQSTTDLLDGLEKAVPAKEGTLVVGYSSRKIDEKADPTFGVGRGLNGRHVLIREWKPRGETERGEVLVHFLAQALGGVGTPDPGSALREKLGNGYALYPGAVVRLDPLNALLLNLWADERRREPGANLSSLTVSNRARMTRLYKALLKAAPGDALALAYLNELDRDVAKIPDPPLKNPDRPPVKSNVRDEIVRKVVRAVTARAKLNAEAGASALKGDELTAAYVHAAADSAIRSRGPEMVSAFLIALGAALDETGALADDAATAGAVAGAETPEERKERIAVLGNPTLAGRRDLCRRFFLGCALGELLRDAAEDAAVGRALFDFHKPANLCFPALAAEFAGIAFARAAQQDVEMVHDVHRAFAAADYVPPMKGLRDCLSREKFEELYGDSSDARFLAVLTDIRKRLKEMKAYK